MSLARWVARLFRAARPAPEAIEAKAVAARISRTADRLNSRLSEYKKARDPFAAMMADFYNRDQVDRIWRGNQHD